MVFRVFIFMCALTILYTHYEHTRIKREGKHREQGNKLMKKRATEPQSHGEREEIINIMRNL